MPVGLPWQEPDEAWDVVAAGSTCTSRSTPSGRTADRRSDFDAVYGDWSELRERDDVGPRRALHGAGRRRPRGARGAAARRAGPGRPLRRGVPGAARRRRHRPRDALPRWPTPSARDVVGDDVTYVVNRNINFTNVCYTGCRFCAFAQRRTDADAYTLSMAAGRRPGRRGVGGRRDRDLHAGRHPPRPARHRVLRPGPRGEEAAARHPPARVLPDGDRQRRRAHRAVVRRLPDRGEGGRARLDAGHGGGDPRRRRPLGADQGQAADARPGSRSSRPRTASACRRRRR